jgi:FlaG/FlaF family flagellin (archaellin)
MKLKLRKTFKGNLKAVSPVIATIIIVAIAITMSIAVAYWLLGLGSSMTRYEKVQFVSAYANSDSQVAFNVKNTGTSPATIDVSTIFINGRPDGTITWQTGNSTATMQPGDALGGTIDFTALPSGTSVEVMIQTTSGNQYPKVVVLP